MNGRMFREVRYWLLYRTCGSIALVTTALARLLPYGLFVRTMTPIFKLFARILIPKRRVLKNLNAAFGETYSFATKKGLAKGVQQHFARNFVDCFSPLSDGKYVRDLVAVRGIDNLRAALKKGKGVIALGAHIGNFVLVGTRLGMEGFPVHTLFRLPPDRKIRALIDRLLKSFYQNIIPGLPRREAVTKILEALNQNEIVFILADNLKKGRVPTSFFGQPVRSPRGPASLALRSKAAVLPVYLIRNYEGGLELVIESEIPIIRNGNLSQDIVQNTQRIARQLESLIRRYPDQWNWLTVRIRKRPTTFQSLPQEHPSRFSA